RGRGALGGAGAFADRVHCRQLVVVGRPVVDARVGPARGGAEGGSEDLAAAGGAAVELVAGDGGAAVCGCVPGEGDAAGAGVGVEGRGRGRRGGCGRGGGALGGAGAFADGVDGGELVVVGRAVGRAR